jgi:hypothetical protein
MSKNSLFINQREKTYSLQCNGSTITEGNFSRMNRTSSEINFDSQRVKTKNVNINWE